MNKLIGVAAMHVTFCGYNGISNSKFHYCILNCVRVVRKSGLCVATVVLFFVNYMKSMSLCFCFFVGAKYLRIEKREYEFVGFM